MPVSRSFLQCPLIYNSLANAYVHPWHFRSPDLLNVMACWPCYIIMSHSWNKSYSTQLNFAWTLHIFIHYKETVFSAANKSILCPVWMLQATDRLQLHLPERDLLDQTCWLQHYHRRSRLHHMVERPDHSLLWLHGVQGGRACQPEERLEKDRHRQHCLPDLPHRRLLRGVLRFQEQPAGQLVPGLEVRCAWLCIGC